MSMTSKRQTYSPREKPWHRKEEAQNKDTCTIASNQLSYIHLLAKETACIKVSLNLIGWLPSKLNQDHQTLIVSFPRIIIVNVNVRSKYIYWFKV